jgi:hypothetical protein
VIGILCEICTRKIFSAIVSAGHWWSAAIEWLIQGDATNRFVSLEQDNSSALVTSRQVVTGVIEFDGGDDISCPTACSVSEFTWVGVAETKAHLRLCPQHRPYRQNICEAML